MQPSKRAKRIEVTIEFLLFGIAIGIVEDILAVSITTGEPITWTIVGIIVLIAIPFAILGEVIVDNVDFASAIDRYILRRASNTSSGDDSTNETGKSAAS
jgi:hypothetical protein